MEQYTPEMALGSGADENTATQPNTSTHSCDLFNSIPNFYPSLSSIRDPPLLGAEKMRRLCGWGYMGISIDMSFMVLMGR